MARYRKIDIRVWGDEKFRQLSAPAPNGQTLWFFLMTGPFTTNIPGVFSTGEMGMAERLKWPIKGFRKAFQEVLREGMVKADWKAPLVWLPNAANYNKPESPNVVRGWSVVWDELPECHLKNEVYQQLKVSMEGFGQGFAKAFAEACRKPLANQEQEQEQEQEFPPTPQKRGEDEFEKFWKAYPKKKSKGQAEKAWRALRPNEQLIAKILQGVERAKSSTEWRKDSGLFIPHPATWIRAKGWEDEVFKPETSLGARQEGCCVCGKGWVAKRDGRAYCADHSQNLDSGAPPGPPTFSESLKAIAP